MPGARLTPNEAELIYFNYCNGISVTQLSKTFLVCRQTIYNVIERAENEGRSVPKPVEGRPKKLSLRAIRSIDRKIEKNPKISSRAIANEIEEELGIKVSHETVRQTLIKEEFSSRSARKKPLLSLQNIQKRLLFANCYVFQPDEWWDDVIFSDEVKIMLYYNEGPGRVWRKPLTALDNRNIVPTIKFGKLSVMIWACISSKGVGDLVFIDGYMDAAQYLAILKKTSDAKYQKIPKYE